MATPRVSRYKDRPCSECGAEFSPIRVDQHFCSAACRNLEHNRELVRGREVYRAAYHWILSNGKGENAWLLTEVSRMIRRWRDADREEGRAPPPFPVDIIKGVKYGRVSTGRSAKR